MRKKRFTHHRKLRATEKIFLALAIIFAFTILSFSNFGNEDQQEVSLFGRILEIFKLEISQTLTKGNLITGAATGVEIIQTKISPENEITGLTVLNKQAISDSMPEILMGIALILILVVIVYTIYHLKAWSNLKRKREEIIQRMEREINKVSGKVIIQEKPKVIEEPKVVLTPKSVVEEIKPVQEWAGKKNLKFSDELERINQKLMDVESLGVKIKTEKVTVKKNKEGIIYPALKEEPKPRVMIKPVLETSPKLNKELKKIEEELRRLR